MTILCPGEFHAAAVFAKEADSRLDALMASTDDDQLRKSLAGKVGQGMRTLLECFAWRAYADECDNKAPYLPDRSEVHYKDGRVCAIHDLGADRLPVRETFITADMAPHSFFFRELLVDPVTREQVDVHDRCWYLFSDGRTQADIDAIPEDKLPEELHRPGVVRTYCTEEAERAARKGVPHREVMRRREGLCGGIIFHQDYISGAPSAFGSWSTHT